MYHTEPSPKGRTKNGMTLLEMVLVFSIIALGFIPLLQAVSIGISASAQASDTYTAIQLAQQKMETLLGQSYASISDSTEAAGTIPGFPLFARAVNYGVVDSPQDTLRDITVTVSWTKGRTTGAFEVETLRTNL